MNTNEQYDIIIIGTGAGGGTLLHTLKDSGKKILVLERGDFLPQEKANWDPGEVFLKERYHTTERWKDKHNKDFRPGTGYWVGGNTKVYGAALYRMREKDFETVQHEGGISPAWPLRYSDFEPYYTKAEKLYNVHGKTGVDATDPYMSEAYPEPPVSHEPVMQEISDHLQRSGYNPSYIPLGIKLNEANKLTSLCIRCDTCDGFPCLIHAKADADINCVRPATKNSNVTLLINAKVNRLHTDDTGKRIEKVEAEINNKIVYFSAAIVVASCGAINTAALFLRSTNKFHPTGLANKSDQVGRNLMKHQNAVVLALSKKKNTNVFQKTLAVSDFYWGDKDYNFPMGHVQMMGKANGTMLSGDAPKITPGFVLDIMASHSIDWWLTSEDLPDPENRVFIKDDTIHVHYTENNLTSFHRLIKRWKDLLNESGMYDSIWDYTFSISQDIPLSGLAHQNGTLKFGTDPNTSVLDINCKTHEIDNLYVVDGSFFVSSSAVNPSLTIIANAIRVGEHLLTRLK
ncbi:MAG TPA: GMC family oxidoreductase [Cytophaga sp.]|jgi:choline dehydrogenase-like flavoprotein|nr:GMC family oxidoreductase [Cytophaga sp.]